MVMLVHIALREKNFGHKLNMLDWLDASPVSHATESAQDNTDASRGTPSPLPDVFAALAGILGDDDIDYLRAMARTEPQQIAETARLIVAAPPFPSAEVAAEFDRLIYSLCDMENLSKAHRSKLLAARQRLAPARYYIEINQFRDWVSEAEARHAARRGVAG